MSTMVATESQLELIPEDVPRSEVMPEDLLAMPDSGHYELIDGELKERKVSLLSTVIGGEITGILRSYCRERNLGWLPSAQPGYRCFPWKPRLVRMADVSFIRTERVTPERWVEGFCPIPPDLAVEVVSPNDGVDELDEKVMEYLRAGVRLVWIVRPVMRAVQIFRGDRTESWLWTEDELSGEDVIPGFRCRVGDLFPKEAEGATEPEPVPERHHR
jgi:Uma2 family endonuclease